MSKSNKTAKNSQGASDSLKADKEPSVKEDKGKIVDAEVKPQVPLEVKDITPAR